MSKDMIIEIISTLDIDMVERIKISYKDEDEKERYFELSAE